MSRNRQQIRDIRINVNSVGAEDTTASLRDLNTEIRLLETSASSINNSLSQAVNSISALGTASLSADSSITKVTTSLRKMNAAFNGGTQTAENRIQSYMDNMELLNITLREVEEQSGRTANNLERVGTSSSVSGLSGTENALGGIVEALQAVIEELRELNVGSRITTARLRDVRDIVGDTGVSSNRTAEELEEMARRMRETGAATGRLNPRLRDTDNNLRRLAGSGSQSTRAFSDMAFGMNPLTALYAKIAINVYALSEAFRFLNEAANFARLEDSLVSFSAGVSGLNVKELAAEMSLLSGSILSVKESMQFAVKGAAFNFTAEQLENLTKGARNASVALGLNMTDALDRVMRGISKQEIELFDELGVVTRLTPAFEAYAATINKTVSELSDYERQLALTIEVQGQLDKRFGSIDGQVTGFEKLSKATKDLTTVLLVSISSALDPYAAALAGLFSGFVEEANAVEASLDSMDTATQALAMEIPNLGIATIAYGQALKGMSEVAKQANTNLNDLNDTITTSTSDDFARSISLGAIAVTAIGGAAILATPAILTFGAALYGVIGTAVVALLTLSAPIIAIVAGLVAIGAAAGLAFEYFTGIEDRQRKVEAAIVSTNRARKATVEQLKIEAMFMEKGINMAQAKADGLKKYEDKYAEGITKINTALKDRLLTQSEADAEMKKLAKEMGTAEEAVAAAVEAVGAAMKATDESTAKAAVTLGSLSTSMSTVKDAMSPVVDSLDKFINLSYAGGEALGYQQEAVAKLFEEFKANTGVDMSFTDAQALKDEILAIRQINYELERRTSIIAQEAAVSGESKSTTLREELYARTAINDRLKRQGDYTKVTTDAENEKLLVLKSQLDILQNKERLEARLAALSNKQSLQEINQQNTYMSATDRAKQETKNAMDRHNIMLSDNNLTVAGVQALTDKFRLEQLILAAKEKQAAVVDKMNTALHKSSEIRRGQEETMKEDRHDRAMSGNKLGGAAFDNTQQQDTLAADIMKQERDIEARGGEDTMGTNEFEAANAQIDQLESSLARVKALAPRAMLNDVVEGMKNVANTQGLDSFSSNMISLATDSGQAMFNIMESFGNENASMMESANELMQSAGSMAMGIFDEIASSKSAAIDLEIAAEKKKDGKSKESLAKIRKLEAQKIKEQKKAALASIGISTAMAVMQTWATPGLDPFTKSAISVGIIALGALQASNANKAASGQIAALSGGADPSSTKITSGTRDNSVDVSKSANAGEYAFLSGQQGQGNANNFSPGGRAGGGYASAGTGIMVGERGPEMITPAMPINVAATGDSKGSANNITISPIYNVQAWDSQDVAGFLQSNSKELRDAIEAELNANQQSLDNLT